MTSGNTTDGIHFNNYGNKAIAKIVYNKIKGVAPPPDPGPIMPDPNDKKKLEEAIKLINEVKSKL